jgi:hypothetical protein
VCAIHQQVNRSIWGAQLLERRAALWRIERLTRLQRERYGRVGIRRDEVDRGVPPTTGLADSLRTVFFRAPVPSGCTLMLVLSSDIASILICTT